jgi:EpsD family peptidyl-prolyl cis-trans isomerase
MKIHSTLTIGLAATVLAFAAGCGKKEEKETKAAATQVAAKVNADEITVSQVNNILARTPNVSQENAGPAKLEILNKLIDQQLAKQQAIEMKLDRTPEVVQTMEAARNEILARAYLDSVAKALPRPTDEDIKKYYDAHPELFSQRRIFTFEDIAVQPAPGIADKLGEQVAKVHSMQDLATWLKSQNIKFVANRGSRPAETIPLDLLPTLASFKEGEMRVVKSGENVTVVHMVSTQVQPVDLNTASPRIRQFLFNQRLSDAMATAMKGLKDKAEIAYLGEFTGGAAAVQAKAKADAEAKAKAQANAEATAKAKQADEAKLRAEQQAKADAEAQARVEALSKQRAAQEAEAAKQPPQTAGAKSAQAPKASQDVINKGLQGIR